MKIFILLVLKHQNQNKSDVLLKWGITHIYLFTGLFYVYHQKYFKAYIKSKNFFFFFNSPHHIEDTQAGSDHEHAEDFEVSFLLLTLFSKKIEQN